MDKLILCSILFAIIGVLFLSIYVDMIKPEKTDITHIEILEIGSYIEVSGIVRDVAIKTNLISFKVCDQIDCIKVNAYKSANPFLIEGDGITVAGILKEYKGSRYIEVKKEGDIKSGIVS